MSTDHAQHPGEEHCDGCIQESNEGYNDSEFTFNDAEFPCCCLAREPLSGSPSESEGNG